MLDLSSADCRGRALYLNGRLDGSDLLGRGRAAALDEQRFSSLRLGLRAGPGAPETACRSRQRGEAEDAERLLRLGPPAEIDAAIAPLRHIERALGGEAVSRAKIARRSAIRRIDGADCGGVVLV